MSTPAGLLQSLRSKGVALWSNGDQLFFRAPTGALQRADIETLKLHKAALIALVDTDPVRDSQPRRAMGAVPLTFSQVLHWRWLQSGERRPMRHMTSATRLLGELSVEAVRESIAEAARRHEALRTRIFTLGCEPMQELDEKRQIDLQVEDLRGVPSDRLELSTQQVIEAIILDRCDMAVDPLFVARILRLGSNDHVLVLAMEHIISDAYSRTLLLRDTLDIYAAKCGDHSLQLPPIDMQYLEYAAWQRNEFQPQLDKELSYWRVRLQGCGRLVSPAGRESGLDELAGWGSSSFTIAEDMKVQLSHWCRRRKTTLALAALTAFVGSVFLWYRTSDAVLLYQSDGRFFPQIQNTVGFFASTLYLRVDLQDTDSWSDLLERVTYEYCIAYEHADHSLMQSQVPAPEFLSNPGFNWISQGHVCSANAAACNTSLRIESFAFENPVLRELDMDAEPQLLLRETSTCVEGAVHFPLKRHSRASMECFGRAFVTCLQKLVMSSDQRVRA